MSSGMTRDAESRPTCHIALGGNLGDVPQTFRRALECLDAFSECGVQAVSGLYRTPPVGTHAGTAFLNAAAQIECGLPPAQLLSRLQALETRLGRTRSRHWGPRTLDLDLLLHGNTTLHTPELTVPHPALWYRRFVLDPLCELAADVVHPVKGVTLGELRERLRAQPLTIALAGGPLSSRRKLAAALTRQVPAVSWCIPDQRMLQETAATADSGHSADERITVLAWLGPDPAEPDVSFEALPLLPRLDVSTAGAAALETLRWIGEAALGSGIERLRDLE